MPRTMKTKPTMADYERWTPEEKQAWQNLGAFIYRLRSEGKIEVRKFEVRK